MVYSINAGNKLRGKFVEPAAKGTLFMSIRHAGAIALVSFSLTGCAELGPRYLAAGRPLYNEAVQKTEAQQLLLNIVRQRYNDPVLFLDVTNITSKVTYTVGSNFSTLVPFTGTAGRAQADVGPRLEDSPLVFYTPNNGEKFVRQVLTPLDLRTLTLVLQAGWSVERVLLLAGESVNGIRNGADADYRALASALRDLQRSGELLVGFDGAADTPGIALSFAPSARDKPAYQTVCKALRGTCGGEPLRLLHGYGAPIAGGAPASLATRSIYSALFFLADGVDVPGSDAGGAARARNPAGPSEDLFHVRTSPTEPAAAAVKVRYRDAWFYIADTDGDSKVTFALLSMLLTLQAGDSGKVAPLLTLPAS